jgi:hypothetical protein
LGLPGLSAYLALWFGAGKMLWTSWSRTSSLWLRALAIGLAGSLLAYFVYGVFDTVALGARPGFLFWVLLGLVASLYQVVGSGQLVRLSREPNLQNKETLPVTAESGWNAG